MNYDQNLRAKVKNENGIKLVVDFSHGSELYKCVRFSKLIHEQSDKITYALTGP